MITARAPSLGYHHVYMFSGTIQIYIIKKINYQDDQE